MNPLEEFMELARIRWHKDAEYRRRLLREARPTISEAIARQRTKERVA